jgi:hypothetical protein
MAIWRETVLGRRRIRNMRSLALVLLAFGCSSSSTADGPAGGGADAPPAAAADAPAGTTDGGGAAFTLKITNYRNWCSITEEGAPFQTSMTFAAQTVVHLSAAPLGSFVWGYWTGTDADTGAHDTSMTATVTMTGDKSVLACCPDPPPASQTCP